MNNTIVTPGVGTIKPDAELNVMKEEITRELTMRIIPFWKSLLDDENGGYYGWLSYDLKLDRNAGKGCILNSRITWFFANAYTLLKDKSLLKEAEHAYTFMRDKCMDREYGGIFWSVTYDGKPLDTTKHTYNQAFAIYALSSYYEAAGDEEALKLAYELYHVIETKCRDEEGYLEAFTRDFKPASNEKLSENGVMAGRTMNTLLHVFEAYTELYRVTADEEVKGRLYDILNLFADKMYNPKKKRQEVFFDMDYNTLIDLHSYGHDIETSWLIDRGIEIIGMQEKRQGITDGVYKKLYDKLTPITKALAGHVYEEAFNGNSLANECERGVVNTTRVWWVQAETVIGFLNAYEKNPAADEYRDAALSEWEFIQSCQIDRRPGSEWFWATNEDGTPQEGRPIVEPWKCPYHNGRMCMEVMKRIG
jgi:mannobiose 2-epimerase